MIRLSNNSWLWKSLLLALFTIVSLIMGMLFFYSGYSSFKLFFYLLIVGLYVKLLRPHFIFMTQELYLDLDTIFLPKKNERIPLKDIRKVKRYFLGFFYRLVLNNNRSIYFIHLDIPGDPLDFISLQDSEEIKELKKRINSSPI